MALIITIDDQALGVVQDDGRAIGTALSFIKPHWYVTAKHVVLTDDLERERLAIVHSRERPASARVLFVHPELDLAVLELDRPVCKRPLFAGHHALAGTSSLIAAGYAPSKHRPGHGPIVSITEVKVL